MPARSQEWPERGRAVKTSQMGEAGRARLTGQMPNMTARECALGAGDRRMRRMRKHTMRRQRATRPASGWHRAAVRNMETRAGSAEPCVRPMRGAAGAAYAGVRCKVRHATTADMGREAWSTSSTMRKMRGAADVGSKMRASATWASRKMRSTATHTRSAATYVRNATAHMRNAATHVRSTTAHARSATANVRSTARMSAAGSWLRRSRARSQTQGHAERDNADRNGSRRTHMCGPHACARESTRALNRCKSTGGLSQWFRRSCRRAFPQM